jgi:arylsulfatase A-like enzyme
LALAGCQEPETSHDGSAASPARKTPNLVIITLDTTRADALGAYGQSLETSPNFDRMAEEGTLFETALSTSPETAPAHASIFTARFPFAHGVRGNAGYLLANEHLTLAEVVNAAGYQTAAEIASIVLRKETQLSQGFSRVRDTRSEGVRLKAVNRQSLAGGEIKTAFISVRDGSDISDSGIAFIREHREDKFFLWLHYFDAHAPYIVPDEYGEKFPQSPYHAAVAYQDYQLGRVIDELRQLGLRDNTLVIVVADHGEGLLDHRERTHGYFLYDTTVRIPMVFWGLEEVSRGRRVKALVRNVDIAPTAIDLLGLYPLDYVDGASLVPLLGGEAGGEVDGETPLRELIAYGEASGVVSAFNISPLRFVREGRWKYIHKVAPELYDVVSDPGELDNRIDAEREVASRLRGKLAAMLGMAPSQSLASVGELTRRVELQLRALGYVAVPGNNSFAREGESLEVFGADPRNKIEDMDLVARAGAAVVSQDFEAALEAAVPLWRRNPESPLAANLLSESYSGVGRYADAIPLLRRSLEFNPRNVGLRERLITALAATGENRGAIDELLSLNLDRSCNDQTLSMLNGLLHIERRFEEQRDLIGIAAADCPELLTNINNYAWILATIPDVGLRDGARAIGLIRQAISSLGNRDPAYLDTLAAGLAEEGRFEEAIEVQTEVIERLREVGVPAAVVRDAENHLNSYRSNLPMRDPLV